MRNQLLLSFALCSFLLFSCGGSKKTTGKEGLETTSGSKVKFVKSKTLTAVLDEAAAKNKVVFVDFYATWCLPCKLMDEEVFTNQESADYLNDNFISYKIDGEKGNGPNLALVYQVSVYPTLLFLDERGRVLERKEGAAFHTELKQMGDRALAANGTLP